MVRMRACASRASASIAASSRSRAGRLSAGSVIGRVGEPRRPDINRGCKLQPKIIRLVYVGRKVAARLVHLERQRLVRKVDHELAGPLDVGPGILDPAVASLVDRDHAERRILGEDVEETE